MRTAIRSPGPTLVSPIIYRHPGSAWQDFVTRLREMGFPIPASALPSCPHAAGTERWLIGLRHSDGEPAWVTIAESSRSRIVPWRRIVRFNRVGPGLPAVLRDAAIEAMVDFATSHRALRAHAAIHEPDEAARNALCEDLVRHGFERATRRQSYTDTVFVDLRPDEDRILASFQGRVRRSIRAFEKAGLECREITDASLSARMNELLGISMGRTGGRFDPTAWADVIQFALREPTHARLVGVFRPHREAPESLVGYVLGYRHGATVEYSIAACARLADLQVPLLYAPTWELIRWGKRNGADRFDFGGVTSGTRESGDPRGGISDFKRCFQPEMTTVGEEMVYAPSPRLSRFIESVSTTAAALRARRSGSPNHPSPTSAQA